MKPRLIASFAVGVAVVLGATGCNMIAPQATTIPYSASDGVNIPSSGPLKVRNALIVADESGEDGNLVAAIVNDTDEKQTLNIGVNGKTKTVNVDARSIVSLGADDKPLLLSGIDTKPGAGLAVTFQSGDGTAVEFAVPVIDGELPYYEEFVPNS
ncbi:glycoside hydrolase family 30 beta sandwich domain-containing protein [Microbacterium sp.]|uniref:glycoside hydrolase family 30 beta sandwich domain-containing protein n=1 Tax=Microbacterium sp. TaxID=51671 RepID=UPI0039E25366